MSFVPDMCLILVVTIFFLCPVSAKSSFSSVLYRTEEGHDVNIIKQDSLAAANISGLIHCTILCSSSQRCRSVFYNRITSTCVLRGNVLAPARSKGSTGWKYWVKRGDTSEEDSCIWSERPRGMQNASAKIFARYINGLFMYDLKTKEFQKFSFGDKVPSYIYHDVSRRRIYWHAYEGGHKAIGYYAEEDFSRTIVATWGPWSVISNIGMDSKKNLLFVIGTKNWKKGKQLIRLDESKPKEHRMINSLSGRTFRNKSPIITDSRHRKLYINTKSEVVEFSYDGEILKEFPTKAFLTPYTSCNTLTLQDYRKLIFWDPRNGTVTSKRLPSSNLLMNVETVSNIIVAVGIYEIFIFDQQFVLKERISVRNHIDAGNGYSWSFVVDGADSAPPSPLKCCVQKLGR